jgi:2-C-methyl-D-erythritol 4-phosphate cytidylyltransferase
MTVALIVAAGSGERLRAGRPKALVPLAGRPLLAWSVDALARTECVRQIIVALPAGVPALDGVTCVEGGASRSDSVRRALAAAAPDGDPILVHDAARPLLTPALAQRVIDALLADAAADAAIAAEPVTDTVKRVGGDGGVRETLDRSELWAVQTPQVFRRAALARALDAPEDELARATDDAWLVERGGGRVIVVPSGQENLKVTTPTDLRLAELLLSDATGPVSPPAAAPAPAPDGPTNPA